MQPLRLAGLLEHEVGEAVGAAIGQPFLDRQAVALRLRDLLALFVEKQLVIEPFRRLRAHGAADLARELDAVDQVLAGHFVVDAERNPPHGPVRLPLQLAMAAGDRRLVALAIRLRFGNLTLDVGACFQQLSRVGLRDQYIGLRRYSGLVAAAADLHKLAQQLVVAAVHFKLRVAVGEARIGNSRARTHIQLHAAQIFKRRPGLSRRSASAAPILARNGHLLLQRRRLIHERIRWNTDGTFYERVDADTQIFPSGGLRHARLHRLPFGFRRFDGGIALRNHADHLTQRKTLLSHDPVERFGAKRCG